MIEWEDVNSGVELTLQLQECEKTMSKDGKDGKDDVSGLIGGCNFGGLLLMD